MTDQNEASQRKYKSKAGVARGRERHETHLRDNDLARDLDRGLPDDLTGDYKHIEEGAKHVKTDTIAEAASIPVPHATDATASPHTKIGGKVHKGSPPKNLVDDNVEHDQDIENNVPSDDNEIEELPEHLASSKDPAAYAAKIQKLNQAINDSDDDDLTSTLDLISAIALDNYTPKELLQKQVLALAEQIIRLDNQVKKDKVGFKFRNYIDGRLKEDIQGKENEIHDLKAEVAAKNKEITELEVKMKRDIDFKNQWVEELMEKEENLKDEVSDLKQEVRKLKNDLAVGRANDNANQETYSNLVVEYSAALAGLARLKQNSR